MGTVNGGTIISFNHNPSLHAVNSRMPSHQNGCANFTFQIPSIANAAKKNTNSAERRANHNAVERARRECLNTKFQELAHALPSLAQVRRPSKSIIVQKSLEFIYVAQEKDKMHEKEMRSIRSENDTLREEVNRLREQLGLDPLPPREESNPPTPQNADDAKEDANISTNPNIIALQNEADNTTNAHSSAHEPQIKSEEIRSDDENSGGNSDDEYDGDSIDVIDGKTTGTDHQIESQNLYSNLIYPSLINSMQHPGFTPNFDFTPMDLPSMDPMVDATGLPLDFDNTDGLTVPDGLGTFCAQYSLTPKFYPSPPYEAAMLDYTGHIGYPMAHETSHLS